MGQRPSGQQITEAYQRQGVGLGPYSGLREQTMDVVGGLPQAFTPETFLAGWNATQLPALAGAREMLQSQLAQRGLTGSGAELGELGRLEGGAAMARTRALSDFMLQRPQMHLGALSTAADIMRGTAPMMGRGGGGGPRKVGGTFPQLFDPVTGAATQFGGQSYRPLSGQRVPRF
jgi:hypothetical protein